MIVAFRDVPLRSKFITVNGDSFTKIGDATASQEGTYKICLFASSQEVIVETLDIKNMCNEEAFFMIYVEGNHAPNKKHTTYASAMEEARRLAKKEIGKKVSILGAVEYLIAEEPTVNRRSYIK